MRTLSCRWRTPRSAARVVRTLAWPSTGARRDTGEILQLDLLHGDHWEVYKTLKEFESGSRDRSVWCDGRLKEKF